MENLSNIEKLKISKNIEKLKLLKNTEKLKTSKNYKYRKTKNEKHKHWKTPKIPKKITEKRRKKQGGYSQNFLR